jgi:hypothetical protein
MAKLRDITPLINKKFGRYTILAKGQDGYFNRKRKDGTIVKVAFHKVLCKCECGELRSVKLNYLISGRTKSCGCLIREFHKKPRTHGMAGRRNMAGEYKIWASMIQRCTNKNERCYKYYGGRGIWVCERWKTFINFYKDMGRRPSLEYSLDRIDVNGNYEPKNCRWTTIKVQSNNRTNKRLLRHNGMELNVEQWAKITGINKRTIKSRINFLKWDVSKALTQPVK